MKPFDRALEGLDAEHRAAIERVLNNLGLPRDDPHALLFAASGYAQRTLELAERYQRRRPFSNKVVLLTLVLFLSIGWSGLLLIAANRLESLYAERYALLLKSESERLAKAADIDPKVLAWVANLGIDTRNQSTTDKLRWAVNNIDAIDWLRSERGQAMRDIARLYAGPLSGSNAPYPCLDRSGRRFTVRDKEINTCTVMIGWR